MTKRLIGFLLSGLFVALSHSQVQKSDTTAVALWLARKPAIERALAGDEYFCHGERPMTVVDAFGTREDPPSVALVDDCQDGAYTDRIVAMWLERGIPVAARIRDGNGKPVPNSFLHGASVMHSRDVKLAPGSKAIFDLFNDGDQTGSSAAQCGVKAYVWNPPSRTFDLDKRLSNTESRKYCKTLRQQK